MSPLQKCGDDVISARDRPDHRPEWRLSPSASEPRAGLGTSVLDAFDRLEVLEATSEAVINSRAIGPVQRMSDATIEELVRAFFPGEQAP